MRHRQCVPARWQTRRCEKGSRYYAAELTQDLLGMWQLVQLAGVAKRRASRG
jgi:hypothetical protein